MCSQHFNSRSCQLVLGAGALQVVGLKTITTKNLGMPTLRLMEPDGLFLVFRTFVSHVEISRNLQIFDLKLESCVV